MAQTDSKITWSEERWLRCPHPHSVPTNVVSLHYDAGGVWTLADTPDQLMLSAVLDAHNASGDYFIVGKVLFS